MQNHEFILTLDPEYVSHKPKMTPPLACSGRQTHLDARHYTVTDHMDALPKKIWDSTVTFDAILTDVKNGTHWDIDGPGGYQQTSLWTVEVEEADGSLVLVEEATITANRIIIGIIKNKILGNSPVIHQKYVDELLRGIKAADVDIWAAK